MPPLHISFEELYGPAGIHVPPPIGLTVNEWALRRKPRKPLVPRLPLTTPAESLDAEEIVQALADDQSKISRAARIAALRRPILSDGKPSCRFILAVCCAFYDVNIEDALSPRRFLVLVRPRQVAMYLSHNLGGRGISAIGRSLKRDHGTVHHAITKIRGEIKEDRVLGAEVVEIARAIVASKDSP